MEMMDQGGTAALRPSVAARPAGQTTTQAASQPAAATSQPQPIVASELVKQNAKVAMFRFGLGPKPGLYNELIRDNDPSAAVKRCLAELKRPADAMVSIGAKTPEQDYAECCYDSGNDHHASQRMRQEVANRYLMSMRADIGFVERLVLFWSNHFSMYREKTVQVKSSIGHFERSVIRKNVLGNFSNMLVDAIKHPAMIGNLDNGSSTKSSPNENLAREILELHTVGTHALRGWEIYDQRSVNALARMLTGWSFQPKRDQTIGLGQFMFKQADHDSSAQTLFPETRYAKTYSQNGVDRVEAVLRDLAVSAFTTQRLSEKLLRHFVTDKPTLPMIYRLNHVFWFYRDRSDQLKYVAEALLSMPEAWNTPLDRIRPPNLWMIAMTRALGFGDTQFTKEMTEFYWNNRVGALANSVWGHVTPEGYPDRDRDWVHPNAMRVRVQLAVQFMTDAQNRTTNVFKLGPLIDPETVRQTTFPWIATDQSVRTRSNGRVLALADMFLSTQFMIR